MLNNEKTKKITKLSIMLVIIFFLLCNPLVSADLFSNEKNLNLDIDESTQLFFLGDISFSGSFQAVDINLSLESYKEYLSLVDTYLGTADLEAFLSLNEVYGFPVFSETKLEQSTVYIINTTLFSVIDQLTPQELLNQLDNYFTMVENASILVKNGVAILGSNVEHFQVDHDQSYGIGGFFQLPLEDFRTNGLGIISDEESIITIPTQTSLFYPFNAKIEITNNEQKTITIADSNTIILVKTNEETELIQDSLLHYFPLPTQETIPTSVTISVTQTDLSTSNPTALIQSVSEALSDFEDVNIEELLSFDQEQSVITLASQMFNSGLILINTTQPVNIDDYTIESADVLVGRGPEYIITVNQQQTLPISVTGTSTLLFLNDHIYTYTAKDSENGVALPFFSILLWIGAIISIGLFFFFKQKQRLVDSTNDAIELLQKRWIRILIYAAVFFIFFVLVDLEFSAKFGVSFFSSLNLSIERMFVLIFLLIQLLILAILFVFYALPALFIHDMLSKTLVKNPYQIMTKIIILIPVFWLGLQIYFLVLLNIFLSFVPWSTVMGLG
jgi:hypothetical protein